MPRSHRTRACSAQPRAGVLQLTDADRADFLHRMTSNNINALRPGQSAVTVLTSPTARILQVFTVVCRADDLLLLPAPDQTAALARHLRGQIFFMDKVKVEDVSAQWTRLRLAGPRADQHLAPLGLDAGEPSGPYPMPGPKPDAGLVLAQPDYGVPGYELLVPADQAQSVTDALIADGALLIDDDAYTVRRVELGRPAPGDGTHRGLHPVGDGIGLGLRR